MKRRLSYLGLLMVFLFLTSSSTWAIDFGTNITIYDQRGYLGTGQGGEDGETEPGMINNQSWDLEGFFLNGKILTMVGGYDFVNGNMSLYSGDIFIDINGDAEFGDGADDSALNYGYDYVIALNFGTKLYNVFKLTEDTTLLDVKFDYNDPESNPWRYGGGGVPISNGSITYYSYLSDFALGEYGLKGGTHKAASVDLAWLFGLGYTKFTTHFTMECGNDNLMGHASVPEPDVMLLLGTALVGLSGLGRKKLIKRS